jgi:RimJ/RimL family protein N-acetyltransferase
MVNFGWWAIMFPDLGSDKPFWLETERLIVRPFRDEDSEVLFAYRNDPLVYKHQGWAVPFTRDEADDFIHLQRTLAPSIGGEWYQPAVELKSTGEVVGDVAFFRKNQDLRQAALGYTLAQAYWHQGYASEAVCAVISYLFTELDLHRIIADCDSENLASVKLLERLGFRREAHFVESYWLGDRWGDEYQYALLKREWIK